MRNKETLELNEEVTHRVYGVGIYTDDCKLLTEQRSFSDSLFLSFDEEIKEVSKVFIQREIC